ncbi:MAG TPA: hypothetical protein DD979_07110 [Gammaproteobacteria bacterium]|jgi:hypothetical protein|nr:hypothetical protein [Gammaproteobacteria bacterium]
MPETDDRQRLLVTVLCGLLLFNYPLLLLASRDGLIFGVPVLYLYLFGVWLLLIVGVRFWVQRLSGAATASQDNDPRA